LAILVRVERRELGEGFRQVFHGGGSILERVRRAVAPTAAVAALGEREPANGKAKHGHDSDCFDVFHTVLGVGCFISPP
jgi:hypothetical protein